jgi:hypothetical protein
MSYNSARSVKFNTRRGSGKGIFEKTLIASVCVIPQQVSQPKSSERSVNLTSGELDELEEGGKSVPSFGTMSTMSGLELVRDMAALTRRMNVRFFETKGEQR